MIVCYVEPDKLFRCRRKREVMQLADVVGLLNDPVVRAMIELRKKMREIARRRGDYFEDY